MCHLQARLAAALWQSNVAGSLSAVGTWQRQQRRAARTRAWTTPRGCLTMTTVANNQYARATAGAATPCMCQDEGLRTPAQVLLVRCSQQETAPTGKVGRTGCTVHGWCARVLRCGTTAAHADVKWKRQGQALSDRVKGLSRQARSSARDCGTVVAALGRRIGVQRRNARAECE